MLKQLRPAIAMLGLMTLLTGVAYPLAVTGMAQLAFPVDAALLGRDQAHQTFQQGGLAHAVTAEQAGDFANLRLEGQAAQDMAAAVVLVELLDF